jgi:hypothetical protein
MQERVKEREREIVGWFQDRVKKSVKALNGIGKTDASKQPVRLSLSLCLSLCLSLSLSVSLCTNVSRRSRDLSISLSLIPSLLTPPRRISGSLFSLSLSPSLPLFLLPSPGVSPPPASLSG